MQTGYASTQSTSQGHVTPSLQTRNNMYFWSSVMVPTIPGLAFCCSFFVPSVSILNQPQTFTIRSGILELREWSRVFLINAQLLFAWLDEVLMRSYYSFSTTVLVLKAGLAVQYASTHNTLHLSITSNTYSLTKFFNQPHLTRMKVHDAKSST